MGEFLRCPIILTHVYNCNQLYTYYCMYIYIYYIYICIHNIDLNAPEARSKDVFLRYRQVFFNDFIGGTSISLHFGHQGLPGSEKNPKSWILGKEAVLHSCTLIIACARLRHQCRRSLHQRSSWCRTTRPWS